MFTPIIRVVPHSNQTWDMGIWWLETQANRREGVLSWVETTKEWTEVWIDKSDLLCLPLSQYVYEASDRDENVVSMYSNSDLWDPHLWPVMLRMDIPDCQENILFEISLFLFYLQLKLACYKFHVEVNYLVFLGLSETCYIERKFEKKYYLQLASVTINLSVFWVELWTSGLSLTSYLCNSAFAWNDWECQRADSFKSLVIILAWVGINLCFN